MDLLNRLELNSMQKTSVEELQDLNRQKLDTWEKELSQLQEKHKALSNAFEQMRIERDQFKNLLAQKDL